MLVCDFFCWSGSILSSLAFDFCLFANSTFNFDFDNIGLRISFVLDCVNDNVRDSVRHSISLCSIDNIDIRFRCFRFGNGNNIRHSISLFSIAWL